MVAFLALVFLNFDSLGKLRVVILDIQVFGFASLPAGGVASLPAGGTEAGRMKGHSLILNLSPPLHPPAGRENSAT